MDLMKMGLATQNMQVAANQAAKKLLPFHVTHIARDGKEHEYDGLFASGSDAARECVDTFGMGKIKVKCLAPAEPQTPEAA